MVVTLSKRRLIFNSVETCTSVNCCLAGTILLTWVLEILARPIIPFWEDIDSVFKIRVPINLHYWEICKMDFIFGLLQHCIESYDIFFMKSRLTGRVLVQKVSEPNVKLKLCKCWSLFKMLPNLFFASYFKCKFAP